MFVLSALEMRSIDRYTMEKLNIDDAQLMYRAGYTLTKDFLSRAKPKSDVCISVFAGVGNNGGDALVIALELQKIGYQVNVFIVGDLTKASNAFKIYHNQLPKRFPLQNSFDLLQHEKEIMSSKVMIDGIFGIGLSKPVTGHYLELIEMINLTKAMIYSVDIPSGLGPETGLANPVSIKASLTGIVAYYKYGNLLNEALDNQGDVKVLDIGTVSDRNISKEYVDYTSRRLSIHHRLHQTHKYDVGAGIFIGGRDSMMGSIQMSAISGLKSGLGISFVFSKLRSPLTQFYPELIIDDIESERFKEVMKKAKVVVFGPGMEEDQPIYQNIMDQLMETEIPLVIDAGGLSYIDINKSSSNPNVVLTPHIGEISKLFGVNSIEIMKDPFTYLHQLTEKGYHVILKGTTSMIAYDKQIIFMQAKNPGLATAGTGDVLAGMIAAFICRQVSLNALIDAFTLHAKTARIARKRHGQTSMIASHLIEAIDEVMIKEENND